MLLGHPRTGRASYIWIKLRQETHTSQEEMKNSLRLNSDDELASYLLTTIKVNRSIRVAESCAIPETTIR